MRRLHHFPLSPFCRKVRLVLGEKKLGCELVAERPWEPSAELAGLNPAGQVPVLMEANGFAVCDSTAIVEYLEEIHPDPPLLPRRPGERAEVRRLVGWFDQLFFDEVSSVVLREKLLKVFRKSDAPNPDIAALRASFEALRRHLDHIGKLADERDFLAGALSFADFAAAAHLSCVDYFGDVPWEAFPRAREWYARIKSRPCFRPLLTDHLPGIAPARHYANLDF
jgi:glutathione S-transferase